MAKVRKPQSSDRRERDESTAMAKLIITEQKENGQFRYREKIVRQADVQDEIKAARS